MRSFVVDDTADMTPLHLAISLHNRPLFRYFAERSEMIDWMNTHGGGSGSIFLLFAQENENTQVTHTVCCRMLVCMLMCVCVCVCMHVCLGWEDRCDGPQGCNPGKGV